MGIFECKICNEEYSNIDESHVPKLLNCGHSICQNCVVKLATWLHIQCPFCREETKVVEKLKNNFELIRAIEKMKLNSEKQETSRNSLPKCIEHPYNLAEFVCMEYNCDSTNKFMCRTCEEFGVHKRHAKSLLSRETAIFRSILKNRCKRMSENRRKFRVQLEAVRKAEINNEELLTQKMKEIDDHFNKLHELLNEKKTSIMDELKSNSLKISEVNKETAKDLMRFQEEINKKKERTKKRINLNDADLFVAGIYMRGKIWYFDSNLNKFPPADTKGMDVKLPTITIEDGN